MAPRACILLAVMAVAAAADILANPVLEPDAVEPGPIKDYWLPAPHDLAYLPPYHEAVYGYHHEPEHKVPDALDPISLPPVIPDDSSKPILILGKPPRGSPPYPPLRYLGRGNLHPFTKETISGWPNEWSHNEWPKEWPQNLPEEWQRNWPEEWGHKEWSKAQGPIQGKAEVLV